MLHSRREMRLRQQVNPTSATVPHAKTNERRHCVGFFLERVDLARYLARSRLDSLLSLFVCLFVCLFFFGFLVAAAQVGAPRQGLGGSRGDPARFGVPHQRRLPGRATDALRLVVQRFRPGQLGPRPVPPVRLQSRRQGAPFFCFCFSIYSFAVSFRFLGVVLVECGG